MANSWPKEIYQQGTAWEIGNDAIGISRRDLFQGKIRIICNEVKELRGNLTDRICFLSRKDAETFWKGFTKQYKFDDISDASTIKPSFHHINHSYIIYVCDMYNVPLYVDSKCDQDTYRDSEKVSDETYILDDAGNIKQVKDLILYKNLTNLIPDVMILRDKDDLLYNILRRGKYLLTLEQKIYGSEICARIKQFNDACKWARSELSKKLNQKYPDFKLVFRVSKTNDLGDPHMYIHDFSLSNFYVRTSDMDIVVKNMVVNKLAPEVYDKIDTQAKKENLRRQIHVYPDSIGSYKLEKKEVEDIDVPFRWHVIAGSEGGKTVERKLSKILDNYDITEDQLNESINKIIDEAVIDICNDLDAQIKATREANLDEYVKEIIDLCDPQLELIDEVLDEVD